MITYSLSFTNGVKFLIAEINFGCLIRHSSLNSKEHETSLYDERIFVFSKKDLRIKDSACEFAFDTLININAIG